MIAVLLPSRRRPDALAESITSLTGTAHQPDRLNVLVAYDPDDHPTAAAAGDQGAVTWEAPTRYGYSRLHEYVNMLTAMACDAGADWLMLWNDDARMLTNGWDTLVSEAPTGVLWPRHNGSPYLNVFPIAHRLVVHTLGHFSLSPHCDSWMQDVATAAGVHHQIDVEILHDRADLTGGHDDQTYREAQAGYRTDDYHSSQMKAARARDADALRAAWTERTP